MLSFHSPALILPLFAWPDFCISPQLWWPSPPRPSVEPSAARWSHPSSWPAISKLIARKENKEKKERSRRERERGKRRKVPGRGS